MKKLLTRLILGNAFLSSDWFPCACIVDFRKDFFVLTFEHDPVDLIVEIEKDIEITFYYSRFSVFMVFRAYKIGMEFLNNPISGVHDARYYVEL